MNVLVTGGAGFIGSHMVDRLVEAGFSVRVIDDLSTGKLDNIRKHLNSGKVTFAKGDIRDASFVEENMRGIDVVLHFAAMISVAYSLENPEFTYDVNLRGTLNLLRSSVEAHISKFVFISSCAVCGDPANLPVTELTRPNPISPYAESKLLGERYCLGFHQRGLIKTVILRFFNVYGPRQGLNDYSGVITKFIDRIKNNQPLTIYGDGLQTRDFVNVKDVSEAILAAATRDGVEGQIFNVGTGRAISINELATTLLELTGLNLQIKHEAPRSGEIIESYADISKTKQLLDYEPKVSLKSGLQELIKSKAKA